MTNASAQQPAFKVQDESGVELSTPALTGVAAALDRFKATNQDLSNFTLTIESEDDGRVIAISFVAEMIPGKRGLGNANRLGKGVTYRFSGTDGRFISEGLQR
jgi:hypothetical protein